MPANIHLHGGIKTIMHHDHPASEIIPTPWRSVEIVFNDHTHLWLCVGTDERLELVRDAK